ncbi:MAG TPA: serine/threonine-protein kinase, partial [Planctomycetaceae bacterium]|nr:serine/threonine-protein kinase [Planctomycetaceae bacterium]
MKFTYPPESRPLDGYTIKRGIERGGFGEVYYALSDGGKEVAIKLLQQNMDVELRGVSQCLNLKHPNLVTIFDIRRDADDDHWIVMEFVSGEGLDKHIARNPGGMPVEDALGWLSGIAAGLTFLHDRGIVHRDLKPANVYREEDVVKIGDVGLSKFISESRRNAQTQSVGTVYYMAPEVAHGRYGREVDIYALGVVLYEMLTGRVPFDGESTAEILMKHLSEKPDLSPLPRRLRPVIGRALEKDPMRRTPGV